MTLGVRADQREVSVLALSTCPDPRGWLKAGDRRLTVQFMYRGVEEAGEGEGRVVEGIGRRACRHAGVSLSPVVLNQRG